MGSYRIKTNIQTVLARSALLAAIAVPASSAKADEQVAYWYGGLGIGYASNDGGNGNLFAPAFAGLCTTFPCQSDNSDAGYKVFGGYQFTELLGLEAEYTRLPKTLDVKSVDSTAVPTSILKVTQDSDVFSLRGVLTKSIFSNFSISGVLGASLWYSDLDASLRPGLNLADSDSDHGVSVSFGARINYDFTDTLRLRGSWDRYNNLGKSSTGSTFMLGGGGLIADTVDTDTDLFSLELVYRFR